MDDEQIKKLKEMKQDLLDIARETKINDVKCNEIFIKTVTMFVENKCTPLEMLYILANLQDYINFYSTILTIKVMKEKGKL